MLLIFFNNTIYVYQSWKYKEGGVFGDFKKTQSERTIEMDKITMDKFKNFFRKRPHQLANEHKLVFFEPANKIKVVTNDRLNDVLRNSLKELDIKPSITAHGLRHTHASLLILKDVSIYYISERLGHADIETTIGYYAHLLKELRKQEITKTRDVFLNMRKKVV
ncbi:tyrosine-type recombinase/integrase [Psychrobacillus sp. NPDC093180]|uniref:tyrosine-type recombinase/integrase n=1 Tax=Psychrobacillus sp. NPDC093180 TaxID=3364489 RepID=UPI003816F6AA